jgi:hypothetical protein
VLDLSDAVPAAALVLCCNLCLLLAMAAGRAESGSWAWGLSLFSEIVLLAASVGAAGWLVLTIGTPYSSAIGVIVALIFGFVAAVILGFLEYAVSGHRSRFVTDLRGSLWPTRIGFRRL